MVVAFSAQNKSVSRRRGVVKSVFGTLVMVLRTFILLPACGISDNITFFNTSHLIWTESDEVFSEFR